MMRRNSISTTSLLLLVLCFVMYLGLTLIRCEVTYDRKALLINGKRRILISGSIHYPRSTPEMWEDLIMKAKEGGLDVIQTYVFWNVHEPSPGNYNFQGRYDLVRFIKTVQKAGLYVHLRIGPYICAEWNFGGFPVWLKFVPGISFRTDNEPFKVAMSGFTQKIVGMMKSQNLFQSQGGPIILSQIENELGPQSKMQGEAGKEYVNWAAQMAVGMATGVPWVMCKQDDAPDPVINTCNGFYCDKFSPNRPYKPTLWTEAWTGWFTEFGGPIHKRPVQDLAFAVVRFIQKGGSFINYYMYHGGTNFGRSAGGPFITTSYDYDAPLDEYGLIRQPKYGHLQQLHKAIKLCETALVSSDPTIIALGIDQEAHVFSSKAGDCAAFLSNTDRKSAARVVYNGMRYNLPPWSVSILYNCRTVVFNTAKVGVQKSKIEMLPTNANAGIFSWETYNEESSSIDDASAFAATGLLEQINITRDASDYLWYLTSIEIRSSESFLRTGQLPVLQIKSAGHALHVFVNGQHSGFIFGTREKRQVNFNGKVQLHAGVNRIALLSVAVGLPNIGGHFETWETGVLGPVTLNGLDQGTLDLSSQKWTYQVGMKGEAMNLISSNGISSVEWTQLSMVSQMQKPLTWHKAYFNAPEGNEPVALDMTSMGKGQVWINGQSIGRYWTAIATGSCDRCSYSGKFQSTKCQHSCGHITQRWYHVPRSWLKPTQNLLVLFEELNGDPTRISLVKRSMTCVCADVKEYRSNIKYAHIESYNETIKEFHKEPKVHLQCNRGQYISSIKFASFGTPLGTCGSFKQGTCHAPTSHARIQKTCIGKHRCSVGISNAKFGLDPCPNVLKRLTVEATCADKLN